MNPPTHAELKKVVKNLNNSKAPELQGRNKYAHMIKTGYTLLMTIITSQFDKICSREVGRQGFILSPMVFNVVNDWILRSATAPFFKLTVDSYFDDLLYADNIVLLNKNEEDVQRFLREISLSTARLGFIISFPITNPVFFQLRHANC